MDTFTLAGKTFTLFKSAYAQFERQVEIPVVLDLLLRTKPENMLEIGNCLSNVDITGHKVVDKYEQAENVLNIDIDDYKPTYKHDLIISISTLEHIGRDESVPIEATRSKLIRIFLNIFCDMLAPSGQFLFTIPIGYNPILDNLLLTKLINLPSMSFLRQIELGVWKETDLFDATTAKYNEPFLAGNVVLFGGLYK